MKKILLLILISLFTCNLFSETRLSVQSHLSTHGVAPREHDIEVIEALKNAGVDWVRHWIFWYQIEHDSGIHDWSEQDSIIYIYDLNNINIYITLMGGNQFYDPETTTYNFPHPEFGLPPTEGSYSMSGWLNFVSATVYRYKDVINYWAIWNEPNLDEYWASSPDPLAYCYLVAVTSNLIKSIDPEAKIIAGNLSMIDLSFLSQVIDSIIPYVDYIGYHPYRLFPEDDQHDFLPIIFPPEDSLYSFEEEVTALIDTIRSRDSLGRVGIWDDESGYPSHSEPILWDNFYNSEITQAKYLLRKFILSLAFNSEVTTWWWDFDLISSSFNILGETWFTNFFDLQPIDWLAKEHLFLFNYIGLSYAQYSNIITIEAEAYDSLSGEFLDSGTFICSPDTAGFDPGTFASYSIPVDIGKKYTVWTNLRNRAIGEIPWCAFMFDSIAPPYYVISTVSDSQVNSFIWTLITDSESLKVSYWSKGPHFFEFPHDTVNLYIVPGIGGTQIDKIILKEENSVSIKKIAYDVLPNLADIFTSDVYADTNISFWKENIDLPPNDFDELRIFTFIDSISSVLIIPFWLGIEAVDNYQTCLFRLKVLKPSIDSIVLIDLMNSNSTNIGFNYTLDTLIIDSLPAADFPSVLFFFTSTGINETGIFPFHIYPVIHYNNLSNEISISMSLTEPAGYTLSVYDISGRLINRYSDNLPQSENIEIFHNMEHNIYGSYFWELKLTNDIFKGKFIIF